MNEQIMDMGLRYSGHDCDWRGKKNLYRTSFTQFMIEPKEGENREVRTVCATYYQDGRRENTSSP